MTVFTKTAAMLLIVTTAACTNPDRFAGGGLNGQGADGAARGGDDRGEPVFPIWPGGAHGPAAVRRRRGVADSHQAWWTRL